MSAPYSLDELYTKLNARFWGSRLPQLGDRGVLVRRVDSVEDLELETRKHPFATGRFFPPQGDQPAEIRVLSHFEIGAQERHALLHEMVHCALWLSTGCPDAGHGVRFIAELERLFDEGEQWAREEAEYFRTLPERALADEEW